MRTAFIEIRRIDHELTLRFRPTRPINAQRADKIVAARPLSSYSFDSWTMLSVVLGKSRGSRVRLIATALGT
jgi:hypothetical protein